MSIHVGKVIRRFNLMTREPDVVKEGYHRRSDDVEYDWETLSGGDDADGVEVVWESLQSMTLKDQGANLQWRRRSSVSVTMDDTSPDKLLCSTFINDTLIKETSDIDLLLFAERFPHLLGQQDDHGRFPVHMACASGGSSDFISKCVGLYPGTAAAQDQDGKTPFHVLCESYASGYDASASKSIIEKRMTSILWVLYRQAPAAITAEDNFGVDAVEYALEASLSMSFLRLVQDMVARVHENNAKKKAHRKSMQARRQSREDILQKLHILLDLLGEGR